MIRNQIPALTPLAALLTLAIARSRRGHRPDGPVPE